MQLINKLTLEIACCLGLASHSSAPVVPPVAPVAKRPVLSTPATTGRKARERRRLAHRAQREQAALERQEQQDCAAIVHYESELRRVDQARIAYLIAGKKALKVADREYWQEIEELERQLEARLRSSNLVYYCPDCRSRWDYQRGYASDAGSCPDCDLPADLVKDRSVCLARSRR